MFLSGLLYGYYILPDAVCTSFDSSGNPLDYVPRKYAFYFFSGICALFNILFLILERLILMIPDRLKPVPNKVFWLQENENKQALNFVISDWFYSFSAVINACLLAVFYAFAKVNSNFQSNILQYTWIFKAIAIVLVIWIIYLPIRLFINKIFIR